jgi:hypothetical protein
MRPQARGIGATHPNPGQSSDGLLQLVQVDNVCVAVAEVNTGRKALRGLILQHRPHPCTDDNLGGCSFETACLRRLRGRFEGSHQLLVALGVVDEKLLHGQGRRDASWRQQYRDVCVLVFQTGKDS